MKFDHEIYDRINTNFKDMLFDKVVDALSKNKSTLEDNSSAMVIKKAIESFLMSTTLVDKDTKFNGFSINLVYDEDIKDFKSVKYLCFVYYIQDNVEYSVFVKRGLIIRKIEVTIKARKESIGITDAVYTTHKIYDIGYYDLNFNIADIEDDGMI